MLKGDEMASRILAAAGAGEDLPPPVTPMGVVLRALADPAGESFDPRFAERVRSLAPAWFDGDAIASEAPRPPR